MAAKIDQGRPVRIAGASGSASDRRHAIYSLASNYASDPVDVIIGDWLSEANMTSLAIKASASLPAYEATFLESLLPALPHIAKHNIKIAVNAGGSDTKALYSAVTEMIKKQGLGGQLKVAWIEGDDVSDLIKSKLNDQNESSSRWATIRNAPMPGHDGMTVNEYWMEGGEVKETVQEIVAQCRFENMHTGESLKDWAFKDEIVAAQAYLGGMGIAAALKEGADIVLCGRVSDASPVIGAATWWHGWDPTKNLEELARAFVAGHLIECSTYVCGGNFSGFKTLDQRSLSNVGFPIAEIGKKGEVVITKQKATGGAVTVDTCKAQLLYEIQGPWYFNSDVTAVLDDIAFEQLATNRVRLTGVKALPPPPTTKVGITARGGFQAEVHWFLVGLDIISKARMLEAQIRDALGDLSRFHVLKFSLNGTCPEDPEDQDSATVDFRVFAQARREEDLGIDVWLRPQFDLIMCTYPGATPHLDIRQGFPKAYQEYFVTLLPQRELKHVSHLWDGRQVGIETPKVTRTFPKKQPSQDASDVLVKDYGETIRGPLGLIVHARSGDKGSNANVGFWVRHQDEYDWMRSLMSVEKVKNLLAKEYSGKQIDRLELPNIFAVHFLLHDHLDRGTNSSSRYDFLAKNVAEFLRSRYVDLPKRFLNRGKI